MATCLRGGHNQRSTSNVGTLFIMSPGTLMTETCDKDSSAMGRPSSGRRGRGDSNANEP